MKTKILRVIARLNIGGPAIHAILLSASLNDAGYRDILVCGHVNDSEGDMSYLAKSYGVEPLYIPELAREISLIKDFKAFLKLYSLIRKEKPDIVHTHTAKAGVLGRLAAIAAGVPIKVHTFHGHIFDGYFSPAKAKIFLLIERFLAAFTDKIVVVSGRVKEEMVYRLKVVGDDKSVVIPLGFELDDFLNNGNKKGLFRKKLGIEADVLLVGIVGRLVPIKNHRMFLDAASRIKDFNPDIKVKFLVVGDGELRAGLEKYALDLGLAELVIFVGWIKDLAEVYADLDVVALSSLNEGTPVSLIEAMASGKPVVSTDVGGVRDVVEDGKSGFLVETGDADGFVSKLAAFLKDPGMRASFGSEGRRSVARKYTRERLVKDMEGLYTDLVSRKLKKTGS